MDYMFTNFGDDGLCLFPFTVWRDRLKNTQSHRCI